MHDFISTDPDADVSLRTVVLAIAAQTQIHDALDSRPNPPEILKVHEITMPNGNFSFSANDSGKPDRIEFKEKRFNHCGFKSTVPLALSGNL